MKKFYSKLTIVLLLIFSFLLFPKTSLALKPSEDAVYKNYDYVIDSYNINMVVNQNNTFDITETIAVYFNKPHHGIYRTIPLRNNVSRLDGTISKNRVQITNISVDQEYKSYNEDGNLKIQMGSPNKVNVGPVTYTLKYTYNLGKDLLKNADELYYNLIGGNWDTIIGNISFNITMPKEFDQSKLGFSLGPLGNTTSEGLDYKVSGTTIKGSYNDILSYNNYLTIRLELEDGYFVNAGLKIDKSIFIILIVPILFVLASLFLWFRYGRDEEVIETVEFYPPEGFNSLEIGYLYKGTANNNDSISLLIYLANKGYLKIIETQEKALFSKTNDFKIIKLKEYDGNNPCERMFLSGLFKNNKEVTSYDLYNSFYLTLKDILTAINNKDNKNRIFEKKASSKKIFIILMIIITFALITIPPILIYGEPFTIIHSLIFPGLGFSLIFSAFFSSNPKMMVNGRSVSSKIISKIFLIIFGMLFGGIPWFFLVLPALLPEPLYLISYLLGLVCIFVMIMILNFLPKRTAYGNEILGKIKGFKNFLETAEKDKLEAMVNTNPTYFYDILPYAYVLGVSDKWIKKFENIAVEPPAWYYGHNNFNVISFNQFITNTLSSAKSYASSSNSSGTSSGGGSSGGGSGGGGGGAW